MSGRLVLYALAFAACSRASIDPMKVQPRLRPYGPSEFFTDGRAMQPPPEGTIAREAIVGDPARTTGISEGKHISVIPVPITRELLTRGRKQYDIACTPCHGIIGDGNGPVATKMGLRQPPSLHTRPIVSGAAAAATAAGKRAWFGKSPAQADETVETLTPGRAFQIITDGYGLMPSYEAMMPADDRWAIVAYLQALQRSQSSRLGDLPDTEQRRLESEPETMP